MGMSIPPDSGHDFHKKNLTSLKGGVDKYVCKKCGLTAKSTFLGAPLVSTGKHSAEKVRKCPFAHDKRHQDKPKKVRIKAITGHNPAFENLTPDSEHAVIQNSFSASEVWVMGVGELVRLLPHEYTVIE